LAPGRPQAYSIYGDSVYWFPLPDATHTVRVYGFKAKTDLTDVSTFGYPDEFIVPMCSIAVRFFLTQEDDDTGDITQLAQDMMAPILQNLGSRWRDGYQRARGRYIHTT
jgi:hypothetical protein